MSRNSQPRFRLGVSSTPLLVAILGLASASTAVGSPTEYFWSNSGGGNYATSSNWTPGGPPTGLDDANFNLGSAGYTVSFSGVSSARRLEVQNDNVTFNLGTSKYSLSDSSNSSTNTVVVGDQSGQVAELTIQNGTLAGSNSLIGNSAGSRGTLTVDGSLGGATFSNQSVLSIGYSGAGTLTIKSGGQVTTTGELDIGANSGSTGMLSIDGAGSSFSTTAHAYVGGTSLQQFGGTGALSVTNGASLAVPYLYTLPNGTVTLQNGTLNNSGGENYGTFQDNGTVVGAMVSYGLFSGNGSVGHLISYESSTILPGATTTPGTLTSGASGETDWSTASTMKLVMNSALGTAGESTGWGLFNVTGKLAFEIASDGSDHISLDLTSLLPNGSAGPLSDFDPNHSYTWTIVTAAGGISGFFPGMFTVDTTDFANSYGPGHFGVIQVGNQLELTYSVPEPSSVVSGVLGFLWLSIVAWRKRRRNEESPLAHRLTIDCLRHAPVSSN